MNAYKIIKKHGVPSGIPVITVYVDPEAPGEAPGESKQYQHVIHCSSPLDLKVVIINNSNEPFTANSLIQWLTDKGYDSAQNLYRHVIGYGGLTGVSSNKFITQDWIGVYARSGSLFGYVTRYSGAVDLADNAITLGVTTTTVNNAIITIAGDSITEI